MAAATAIGQTPDKGTGNWELGIGNRNLSHSLYFLYRVRLFLKSLKPLPCKGFKLLRHEKKNSCLKFGLLAYFRFNYVFYYSKYLLFNDKKNLS